MNESINGAEPEKNMQATIAGTGPIPKGGTHSASPPLKTLSEELRLEELEADNARLLRLVGELLVLNQQLREQSAAGQHREEQSR